MQQIHTPEKGCILAAEPFLGDPSFERTVILLTEHNEEGTVGFVLNKPLEFKIDVLLPDFPESDVTANYGGPVQQDNLYYLHTLGELLPGSIEVMEGLWWGGDLEVLKDLIRNEGIEPNSIRFFLGYSGWGPGQLEMEMDQQSWVIFKGSPDWLFHKDGEDIWKKLLLHLGGSYQIWANSPTDPILN
ncbi:MAG: YqgE/AlgH family protein [Bacteroidota bacterium]|nr:YqgE/AlgH family protein [Bacteroidota bacterium]MDX5428294.1 YqgE/AlgH family protein [Bacteroidota bacterium]MDX5447214.1 YqgE/AlgH family protein [Bacteroidota bacterium]MDX5506076.1 YqgE/AlgH family protein [Bacteroidota bacterium]